MKATPAIEEQNQVFSEEVPDFFKADYEPIEENNLINFENWQWAWAFLRRNKDYQVESGHYVNAINQAQEQSGGERPFRMPILPGYFEFCKKWHLMMPLDYKTPTHDFIISYWADDIGLPNSPDIFHVARAINLRIETGISDSERLAAIHDYMTILQEEGRLIFIPNSLSKNSVNKVLNTIIEEREDETNQRMQSDKFPEFLKAFDLKTSGKMPADIAKILWPEEYRRYQNSEPDNLNTLYSRARDKIKAAEKKINNYFEYL